MNSRQGITINCPHCGFSYQTPIVNVIDVGQVPELKTLLLSGELNASQCPSCRNVNYVATPILYHDPEHEFLGVYVPEQMRLSETRRQQLIGDMTRALLDSLPSEKRRGYMLNPQQFLTLDSLVEKIYSFDGITPEMLAASRRKMELVSELLRLMNDDIAFTAAVQNNREYLDEDFFTLLAQVIYSAEAGGDEKTLQQVQTLREKLIPLTEVGARIQKQRQAVEKLGKRPRRSEVLEAIVEGDLDEAEAIAVATVPLLDYTFFSQLTERIEAAEGAEKEDLENKRERILQIVESVRAAEAETMQNYAQILQHILSAENLEEAVRQHMPYLDQNLMYLLEANIAKAKADGADAAAERLTAVKDTIHKVVREVVPEEVVLLNLLLTAESPDEMQKMLRARKELVNERFLDLLQQSIQSLEAKEAQDEEDKQVLKRLRNIQTYAQLTV